MLKIGVVGAGQMGTGIAITALKNTSFPVRIVDSTQKALSNSKLFIENWCKKQIQKNKLTQDKKLDMLSRAQFFQNLTYLEDCNFIIQAVTQKINAKQLIFTSLTKITKDTAIFASNTSSISITKLASVVNHPQRFIGMHFMNPVPVMKLIEIIPGLLTSTETIESTKNLSAKFGKQTAISKDIPGFIANRLLMPYINQAVYVLYQGIATKDDIDKTMKLGTNVPMGPLALADFIGLDTCLFIMQVLHQQLGDSKYRPCPLLTNYVSAGLLGKKTGQGFYKY